MNALRLRDLPRTVMLVSAVVLFADLFLRWQGASSSTGMFEHATAGGWHGWGALAGFLLMGIVLRESIRLLGARVGVFVDLLLAGGVLLFVVARLRDAADATIGLTTVHVGGTLWPAWLGLALAIVLAVSALVVAMEEVADHRPHFGHLHAPAAA